MEYSRGTLAIPIALVVAAAIELVAFHLLVPWPTVRLVLDLLGVYALIVILGWLAGRIVRPHLVVDGELVLRSGPHVCARVPLDAVVTARRDRRLSPTAGEIVTDGGHEALALPGPDGSSLTLVLNRPVEAEYSSHWGPPVLPPGASGRDREYCAWGPAVAPVGATRF